MKILTYLMAIFLVFGLLGVPSGVFAQETSLTGSSILQASNSVIDNTAPLLKGGIKTKAAKKIHSGDDDDTSNTGNNSTDDSDDGSGWWVAIIIIIIIIAIIILAVWFFFLRK